MPNPDRRPQLERLAFDLGLRYREEDDWGMINQLKDFKLFQRGFRGRIRHMLHQQEALMQFDLRIFDYRYVIPANNHARVVKQTVFFLKSQRLNLPQCWMRPEHFFHKIGELLGFGDIDFEEHPEFSARYRLTGEDEDYIRHRFNDRVLHFFQVERGWTLEGLGFYMLLYKKNKILSPSEITQLYQNGKKLYQLFLEESV